MSAEVEARILEDIERLDQETAEEERAQLEEEERKSKEALRLKAEAEEKLR